MADPTGGMDVSTILTYASAAIGTGIAAFVVRMGWKSGAKELAAPSNALEIKSALVDSSSVVTLAQSIEGVGVYMLEQKKVTTDQTQALLRGIEKLIGAIENQTHEVRELSREVRELSREVGKKSQPN